MTLLRSLFSLMIGNLPQNINQNQNLDEPGQNEPQNINHNQNQNLNQSEQSDQEYSAHEQDDNNEVVPLEIDQHLQKKKKKIMRNIIFFLKMREIII